MNANRAIQLIKRLSVASMRLEDADAELRARGGGVEEVVAARNKARHDLESTVVSVAQAVQKEINVDERDPDIAKSRKRADDILEDLPKQPPANSNSAIDIINRNEFVKDAADSLQDAIWKVALPQELGEPIPPAKVGKMTKTYREIYDSLTKSPGRASLSNALEELGASPDDHARIIVRDWREVLRVDPPTDEEAKAYSINLARMIKKFVDRKGGKRRKTHKGKSKRSRRRYSRRR